MLSALPGWLVLVLGALPVKSSQRNGKLVTLILTSGKTGSQAAGCFDFLGKAVQVREGQNQDLRVAVTPNLTFPSTHCPYAETLMHAHFILSFLIISAFMPSSQTMVQPVYQTLVGQVWAACPPELTQGSRSPSPPVPLNLSTPWKEPHALGSQGCS